MSKAEQLRNILNKKFNDCARLARDVEEYDHVSTGLYGLDSVTSGGIPIGAITLFAGKYSTTKSALSYNIAGQAYKYFNEEKPVVVIHAEGPIESITSWAYKCGLPANAILIEDNKVESALNTALEVIRSGMASAVIIDSLGALVPGENTEVVDQQGSFSDRAKLINNFMTRVSSAMPKDKNDKCVVLCTNHYYQGMSTYGPKNILAGGTKQEYMAVLIIELYKEESGTENIETEAGKLEAPAWVQIKWRLKKNKCGPDHVEGVYRLYTEDGLFPAGTFSEAPEALIKGMRIGHVNKGGAWYTYKGVKYHGEANLLPHLDVAEIFTAYSTMVSEGLRMKGLSEEETSGEGTQSGKDVSEAD